MSIKNKLNKLSKHKRKWAKRLNIGAYRLYDRNIPEYPYIVDIYNEFAVVYSRLSKIDTEDKKLDHKNELIAGLLELGFLKEQIILKERSIHGRKDQYEKAGGISQKNISFPVEEGPLLFKVDLTSYLDTGLFLDHRPLREKILQKNLSGKKALNLFSYTGSISVALAHADAIVTSVDLSNTYIGWSKENFNLNKINEEKHYFFVADCLNWLREAVDQQVKYDIIIVDPPTFSTSKKFKGTWDVERDHAFLLKACDLLLNPGGECYFSTNLRSFKIDLNLTSQLMIKDISLKTIPEDFHDKKIHHCYYWKKGQ